VDDIGRTINEAQKTKKLDNQRFFESGAGHCALPATALPRLLKDESRLTTRPPAPAPAPPPKRSPSESFFESLRTGGD
jgi:hypothetical protein